LQVLRKVLIIYLLYILLVNQFGYGWVTIKWSLDTDTYLMKWYLLPLFLSESNRKTFLIILCAVYWSIWIMRNYISFQHTPCISNRNMLIKICSLIQYWSRTMPQKIKSKMKQWMSLLFEMIPLQTVSSTAFTSSMNYKGYMLFPGCIDVEAYAYTYTFCFACGCMMWSCFVWLLCLCMSCLCCLLNLWLVL
jgi:hypothetical protein